MSLHGSTQPAWGCHIIATLSSIDALKMVLNPLAKVLKEPR